MEGTVRSNFHLPFLSVSPPFTFYMYSSATSLPILSTPLSFQLGVGWRSILPSGWARLFAGAGFWHEPFTLFMYTLFYSCILCAASCTNRERLDAKNVTRLVSEHDEHYSLVPSLGPS